MFVCSAHNIASCLLLAIWGVLFCRVLELPLLDSFFEFDPLPLPYNTKQLSLSDFQDFEDLDSVFFLAEHDLPFPNEDAVVEQRPLNSIINYTGYFDDLGNEISESLSSMIIKSECASSSRTEEEKRTSGRKKSATVLELDEIQRHFDVPITKAAREMNVGLTVLKKRCRELNILRWPHRKIKSLKSLIDNVKVRPFWLR